MSESVKEPIDVRTGMRLRALRMSRSVTQHLLAEQVGVSAQQIEKYERGINRLSVSRLIKIARAFAISPMELLGDKEHNFDAIEPSRMILEHIKVFQMLTHKQQHIISDLIRSMVKPDEVV